MDTSEATNPNDEPGESEKSDCPKETAPSVDTAANNSEKPLSLFK